MATATKERPILFSAPMVRAIIEGRKTQTRRILKPQPVYRADVDDPSGITTNGWWWTSRKKCGIHSQPTVEAAMCRLSESPYFCPYGQPGDLLWVRERLVRHNNVAVYAAEYPQQAVPVIDPTNEPFAYPWKWKRDSLPSIHMPRWASRIRLEITEIHRVERLQDISFADCRAEGMDEAFTEQCKDAAICPPGCDGKHRGEKWHFLRTWHEINGPESWAANPWVWVIEFRRVGE